MSTIPGGASRLAFAGVSPASASAAQAQPRRIVVRLWIPATAILWLLSPIPLVLAPLLYLAPQRVRPANPYAAVLAVGRVLTALGGTLVDVDTPDCLVRIRIS